MRKEKSTYFGTFQLHGKDVWGQVQIAGSKTQITLRSDTRLNNEMAVETLYGRLHDFSLISCIDCVGSEFPTQSSNNEGFASTSWNIFSHQILIGNRYFDPAKDKIKKVWFSIGDIYKIFDDHDSFGTVFSPSEELQNFIPKTIGKRLIPSGPDPKMAFFSGRTKILTAQLSFGKFEVLSAIQPKTSSNGASLEAHMWLQIEFKESTILESCLNHMKNIAQFLGIVAGRSQGVEKIRVEVGGTDDAVLPLDLYWILGPRQSDHEQATPWWLDLPLDGVRRTDEFTTVIEGWFSSDSHRIARARLSSCLEAGDLFTPDRLITAANLFELLIIDPPNEISPELEAAKNECLRVLEAAPWSDDRDSAIQGIKRLGSLTLLKKIQSRAKILSGHFLLNDLDKVLRQAVLFRNYFVHGSSDTRFKYLIVNPYSVFLTETLEFVFTAAELIDCGWDAGGWRTKPHTSDHWFTRYLAGYERESRGLMAALELERHRLDVPLQV